MVKHALAGCAVGLMLVACGGAPPLTAESIGERFQEATGIPLELQEAHAEEKGRHKGEKGHEEGEVFLEPKRLTRADRAKYGRFTLVFWPENPLVDDVWNHDFRGWTYQTTYGDVALLWRAGRERRTDARWRELDAVVRRISSAG